MERELEALAARPTRPAEPPFQALVEAAGGRGQVLLVGELWEREQSRALLLDFARAVFPPEPGAGKPSGAAAEGADMGAAGRRGRRGARHRLALVSCFARIVAGPPGAAARLREMLRDVRGRRRAGRRWWGCWWRGGPEDAVALGLRLLEALLRAVFGRQAAAYCRTPASCLAVQAAACRALQAAGAGRPVEGAWERPGLPGLLACFSWGPWSRRKDQGATACRSPAQDNVQEPEEQLALTAIFPNGDCEDLGRGSKACDGIVHTPAEPSGDLR
uniref:Chromosome 2 open reading frame 72 n=1 Tax=Aotus nancymaae TaxID=37293 RepID=A0A2K5F114_AOTNA